VHDQGRHDLSALSNQDVVGAACCGRVHGLDADARRHQGAQQGGARKAQLLAAAEHHQFGPGLGDRFKVGFGQVGQRGGGPGRDQAGRRDQDAAAVNLPVHRDRIGRVGVDDVDAFGVVGKQFHGAVVLTLLPCSWIAGHNILDRK